MVAEWQIYVDRLREDLPDNEDGYSSTSQSSSSSKDRTRCSSKTFKETRKTHREEAWLLGKFKVCSLLKQHSCKQRTRNKLRGKIYKHLQTHSILRTMDPHMCVRILTLSISAGSSAWSSLVMPVQNKKYLTRSWCMTYSPPPPIPKNSQDLWIWLYYPRMENWPMSCCARAKQRVQRKSTYCLLWGCYFERINRWLLKSGQG